MRSAVTDKEYICVGLRRSQIYRLLSLRDFKEYSCADISFDEYIFPASQLPSELKQEARPHIDCLNTVSSIRLLSKNTVPDLQHSIKPIRKLATPDQKEPIIEPITPIEANESEPIVEPVAPMETNSETKPIVELNALIEASSETKPIVELDALMEASSDTRINLDSRVRSLEDSCDRAEKEANWRSTRA